MTTQETQIPGSLIVHEVNGTAGTQVTVTHDGTNALITPGTGVVKVQSGLTVTGSTVLATSLNGILKTSSGTVSGTANLDDLGDVLVTSATSGDVLHYNGTNFINSATGAASGVEPYDATILKSADIGSTVEGYDATILKSADIGSTVEGYDATILKSADIGSTVEGYDATILKSASIGVTVEGYDATILKSDDIGSTVEAHSTQLDTLSAYNTDGLITQTSNGTFTGRTITGSSGNITVSNGNGTGGNPTVDLVSGIVTPGTYTKTTVDTYGRVTTGATASLSDLSVPTADLSIGTYKLTNVVNPTQAQDAATKSYVDTAATSIHTHTAAAAATTANLTSTYTAGTTGADGGTGVGATLTNSGTQATLVLDTTYTAVFGDRILVKDQSTQTHNGIYTVSVIGDGTTNWELTRATDSDNHANATDLHPGDFIFITSGTINKSTGWVESSTGAVVIDTTPVTYTQFSGAGTYTAGTGLTLFGSQFSITNAGTAGTYKSVTTNAQGQVTSGTNPTTLVGFGITDAQPLDSDLTAIAALSQTSGNVIRSDGTNWNSSTVSFDDLGDVIITTPASGNVVYYNGTHWVNAATGATSGVQGYDATTLKSAAIGVTVEGYDATILKSADIGSTVEGYDATILKSAAIGVTVEGYDATILKSADIGSTVEGYDATILKSAAIGVTVEGYDATILKSADIGSTVEGYDATILKSAAIGSTLQAWDADLDTISALSQGTSNVVISNGTTWTSAKLSLNDINSVLTTSLASGNILYYNGTNFINSAPGATSGVQPYDADLATIAGLTATSGNVIRGNGTVWTSSTVSFDDLGDVIITTPASGNVVYYNGTNWVNSIPGATSGVQAWDADLDAIAALAQGTGNSIISNGTNWTSRKSALATDISDVVITTPSNTQVLTYNGTNWVNSAATGGDPLDTYFNSANTVLNELSLTTSSLTTAYTQGTAGRAVITSIVVANVDGTSEYAVDGVINDGTTDFYFGKIIPIPANTSLELIIAPKILLPNHILKYKADTANKLQIVTTIAPEGTNTKLYNAMASIGSTSQVTVYTESNAAGSVVNSITVANDDSGTSGVQVTVEISDGTTPMNLTYLMNIPQKSAVEICQGPKFLPNTGTIKITASDASRVDIIVAGRKL